ncbi:efflux RND transporter permease subunit [Chitinophaga sp. 30R24]|uniref:efflux RND transporter permease subunit n=1 Tax=Chitinophaga sp. 30R24 TaxID=3248838 RepID=UPI003B90B085
MNFVQASLKYKQVTLSVLFLLFALGVNSLLTMPRREDPRITVRQGLIIAYFPGANSEQVEDQVTRKLEQYLFQYAEINKAKTYSTSSDGMVVVNVELGEHVKEPDIFWNKLRHQLLIAKEMDLPKGVQGPIVDSDFGDTEALVIGVMSNNASYLQMKDYVRKLEDAIRTLPATSKLKRIGEQKEQITVSSNSEKLSQYGISIGQVMKILQSQNNISATGDLKTGYNKAPLYTEGYYTSENEIANQIVGTSQTGEIVHLGDVATLTRSYEDPTSITTVNGNKAMMLAIQMLEGNNIVKYGAAVQEKVRQVQALLPADVKIATIVNQPRMVDLNVSHFIREFFLAIISVIVVIILLLPFRIAMVAAMAIPMTVSITFALMHTFGIELHQVSLAALIVVLGMVVDDAIVIADNYVELLDEGTDRWTAAWRSASDLVIPVLTATITIIASFMPMIFLTGAVGEFIKALPLTVAIALGSSFLVAMVLTPMLCYTFIHQGLHRQNGHSDSPTPKRSLLDRMQQRYDVTLKWCVAHPVLTVTGSLCTILLAGLLYFKGIREQFFPAAERNQLVVELWMPTGARLEKTKNAILKAQAVIQADKRVVSFATFIGASAPRFYYNFSPEVPVPNYAQILVNTTNEATTNALYADLYKIVDTLVPEGTVQVKLMQQGQPLKSPVEVRIIGDNIQRLEEIAARVEAIIKKKPGSKLVRNDYKEAYYGISIQLNEDASRLGFTTTSISQSIYTGFAGAPVSTMYEGNEPVDIVLRLDEQKRRSTNDLINTYVQSPVTEATVPLRQLATLSPQWYPGNIVRRNGVRTLTVQSETSTGTLPSELLAAIRPDIAKIPLPVGYYIEYGGEYANQEETFGQMIQVLGISLVAIFLVLLVQFRNLKEVVIVMLTIPLSLFGAMLGLFITGNNFSFTAFVGLISLSGIVVRNAIILLDHTNELIRLHGMDCKTAALESGKRRLRPIFLTAMAAAIGVLPMILSGSPMWSPLASVIAVGVIWSMLMALLTVPVLYTMWMKPPREKTPLANPQQHTL